MIYTGTIDYYFDYKYGKLPYRTLEMKFETHDVEYYQPVAVLNYPNDYDFTRITEFKHMTGQKHTKTTIVKEFPKGTTAEEEPYYPALNEQTSQIVAKYREEVAKEPTTIFVGRLAEYKYYNMDIVVAKALEFFEKKIGQGEK